MVPPRRSVRGEVQHPPAMLLVELTCGEAPCEVTVVVVEELSELDLLVCDECGHCVHLLSVSEAEIVEARMPVALPLAA